MVNHFFIGRAVTSPSVSLVAAAHGEQRSLRVLEGEALVALRNDVERDGSVEHLVVIAEVVARNQTDSGFLLQLQCLPFAVPFGCSAPSSSVVTPFQ